MDPQQPYGSQGGGNYDFIINPEQQPKKSMVPQLGGDSAFTKKLIFIIGGAVILIILMWIVGSMLGGGTNTTELTKLVQRQQEVMRVSAEGATSGDAAVRNAAANTTLSVTSQQQQWLVFLAQEGVELEQKQRELLENATTDSTLATARSNNTFDSAFLNIMQTYLTDYAATIQTDYANATGEKERTLLSKHYDQIQLLLKQYPER